VPGSCISNTTALSASCYNIKHHSPAQHESDFVSDTQQSSSPLEEPYFTSGFHAKIPTVLAISHHH
jgi:hypothetical protein